MAKLIYEVFGEAEVYVLKLDGSDSRSLTAESAAEAVRWAIHHKVDIISASWAISAKQPYNDDQIKLDDALKAAAGQNILIFCAASDGGPDTAVKDSLPAAASQVFCIGGATGTGVRDPIVGKQAVKYLVPGSCTTVNDQGRHVELRGSSVATALAAGLAGVILQWISISPETCFTRSGQQEALMKRAKRFGDMDGILERLSVLKDQDDRLISHKTFESYTNRNDVEYTEFINSKLKKLLGYVCFHNS